MRYLDVGIFASTSMMSLQDGEGIMEDLRDELERLGKD
jgi:hypothetical protein